MSITRQKIQRLFLGFLLGVLANAACLAASSEETAPALGPDEALRLKAKKLVVDFARFHAAYKNKNAVVLVEALHDQPFVIARVFLQRLATLGMPDQLYIDFRLGWRNGDAERVHKSRIAIAEWAAKYNKKMQPKDDVKPPSESEAVLALCQNWEWQVNYEPEADAADTRDFVAVALGCAHWVKERQDKTMIARTLLDIFDKDELQAENFLDPLWLSPTGIEIEKHVDKAQVAIASWIRANLQYCYFHPVERRMKVDKEARDKQTASDEYRKQHPWKSNEGPNLTNTDKKPVL